MRGWYAPHDVLGFDGEYVVAETVSMEETIGFIAAFAGLPLQG